MSHPLDMRDLSPHSKRADLNEEERGLALLLRLHARLSERAVIDVGAGRGVFVEAFLEAGCPRVFALEPDPPHVHSLRERFAGDARVRVLDVALGAADATVYAEQVAVTCRSVASLVEDRTLPAEVGVLRLDTGGHDLEVVRGMDGLSAAVVMVEYRDSPPDVVGTGPHSLPEIAEALAGRGYSHVLVVKRHDGFQVVQLDSCATRPGDRGHALFVHDRVYPRLAPLLHEAVVEAQTRLLDTARELRREGQRHLEVIAERRSRSEQGRLPTRRDRWLAPRLGHLRHHPPRPLAIPDRYRAEPPAAGAPRISVVTPTLNAERFLERTLRSVLDQGFAPLEYVLQDGGSVDGTLSVLERYRDRLAGIAVAKDGGQADALNRGFARTTGEIMAYLNADDLLLPGALHYVGRFFSTHPDVDVVYGHRVLIDENDQEIGRWVLPRHDMAVLAWADYVPQETLFWRRGVWERAGGRLDDTFHFAMDWDLLLRFRTSGARFARLPRFLGAFRVHEDQKTSARIEDLGVREMARLREREHGRPVTPAETSSRVRGYLLRHMAYQKLYRVGLLRY